MNKIPLKELEELVTAGVIPQATADKISVYYQEKKQSAPNTFVIVLGILGALLTGSGILLIVAHNWDELSLPVKTLLSFLPLVLSQLACVYTLLKRNRDRTWIECSSLMLFFSIGASISLISQIYQVSGSLTGFLLVWVLLSLPLVYLLSANILALLAMATITWYAVELGYFQRHTDTPFMYLAVLAVLAPHYYRLFRQQPDSNFFYLLNWFGAVSVIITLAVFVNKTDDLEEWIFLLYCIVFCIYYLVGRLPFFGKKKLLANPFLIIGTLGIIVTLLSWSFSFLWSEYKLPDSRDLLGGPLFYFIFAGMLLVLFIVWKSDGMLSQQLIDPLGYSFAILLLLLVFFQKAPSIAVFIINAWTVFIAIFFIRKGSLTNHLGILNFGLIIIASLAICRFFDEHIPFVWRGIFFLATGVAFFAGNYLMIRKRKEQAVIVKQ